MTRSALPADPDFEALLEHLRVHRATDFTGYKRASLMRLVDRRLATVGVATYRDYQDLLQADPGEFARLFDGLLVNVTSFFRDPPVWEALRTTVLPELLEALPDDAPLRIWCAACATGQEAYSLALLLDELLGREAYLRRVKIYATDIDEAALAEARVGRYPLAALDAVPERLRERGFEGTGDVRTISAELRPTVIFGRHDLIQDAPIGKISLLSCRNALMYFNPETQARVLERLSFALLEQGVLVLGKAEMLLTHSDLFVARDLGNRLFRRSDRREARQPARVAGSAPLLGRVAQAAFVGAPEAQLVLDADGTLALVNAAAVRALGLTRDDVGRPFQDLEISYRPVELRSSIEAASRSRDVVEVKDVAGPGEPPQAWYDVQVVPLVEGPEQLLGVQITFRDVTRYHALTDQLDTAHRELETAYEELQSSNEELETTNEELQSAVEELETTNEELQSTNEELETMNEELQSTNEELQTLNDELRVRTVEVNQVNAFLESILTGLRGGVVVVDGDLVVRVWNSRAEQMWGLRDHEATGSHFLNLDIGLPVAALRDGLREVLSGDTEHRELRLPAVNRLGRSVQCSIGISPLRTYLGVITGAIVVMEEQDLAA